jgi:hypothetical protein
VSGTAACSVLRLLCRCQSLWQLLPAFKPLLLHNLCLAASSADAHAVSSSCRTGAPVQEDAYAPWTPPRSMMGGDPGAGPVLQSRGSSLAMRSPPAKLPASPAAELRLQTQAAAVLPLSYH